MSRLVKGILIYLFLTIGLSAFNYSGVWFNKNASIPKIVIKNDGTIQAFGKCAPNNCDWGTTTYIRTKSGVLASWKLGKIHKFLLVEAVNKNRVKVILRTQYCNTRKNTTKVFYLNRANITTLQPKFDGSIKSDDFIPTVKQ